MKLALPKGRLWESVVELLEKSNINIVHQDRNYKPKTCIPGLELFIIKPRNIPKMVESGMVDAGIIGKDLVYDEEADVNLVLDLKTMPVFIVIAGKSEPKTCRVVATEYTGIAKEYLKNKGLNCKILKTYGSTECFVPDFADIIIDHTQTGTTLKQNKLRVFDIVMKSTTHLISNKNLNSETLEQLEKIKQLLISGIEKIDMTYPDFLTEKTIRGELA